MAAKFSTDESFVLVIAIDFGTTYSGYAFSFKTSKDEIRMNKNWGAEVGFQTYKTPTSVLFKPNGQFQSFGFQAENEFSELDEDEIEEGYQLYRRFKMELYERQKLDSHAVLESTTGRAISALKVFAASLQFMKKHCLEAVGKSLGEKPPEEYIRWVITVPAIWSDTAKKFMRLAAKEAGLVSSMDSQNLVIALEPEAASLYCRSLDLDKFIGMDTKQGKITIKPGEKYMVVDCGGGTIDIAVHELDTAEKVHEIEGASGGPWGGNYVDRKYCELLDEIFGKNFMNMLKKDYPSEWLNIATEFENKKRASGRNDRQGISISFSMAFAKHFEKFSGKDFEQNIKQKRHLGIKFQNGKLRLSGDKMNELYSEVIPEMKRHVRNLLRRSNAIAVNKIFVVGGFAESDHIQSFLRSEFGHEKTVLIPEEAGMCIMKGAVLFGHNPSSITSRIARFNYGVETYRTFIEGLDDPARKQKIGNLTKIRVISRMIKRFQKVGIDEVVEHTFQPLMAFQTEVAFILYSTEEDTDDPMHPTVRKLEEITVSSPDTEKGNRNLKASIKFGGTDILFQAVDEESGNKASAVVKI